MDPKRQEAKTRSRPVLHKVASSTVLLLVGLVVGLVVAELVLAAIGQGDRGGVFTATQAEFDRLPGIFAPGQRVTVHQVRALPFEVEIDSLGYRGADFARQKAADELRILFVGDSFVFGDFVDTGESLPAQLETALAARCESAVRVINAGLGGSTIRDQIHMIERAWSLDPDVVIVQFSENDVRDLAGPSMWSELASNREVKSRLPISVLYPLVRRTALWNLALRTRAVLRERRLSRGLSAASLEPGDGRGGEVGPARGARSVQWYRDQYRTHLAGLKARLDRNGQPFVLTVYPSHLSVYGLWASDQLEWLDTVIDALQLDAVRFLPVLSDDGRPARDLYLMPHDGHASAAGYRIAAEDLADSLISLRILPYPCR